MPGKLLSFLFLLIAYSSSAQYETSVYFDFDKADLTKNATVRLDSLISNKKVASLDIYGHCDQLGSKEYNYKLSERRADAVRDYLISKGVEAAIIKTIKGFGEDQPLIDRLDEMSRQANRRVSIFATYAVVADVVVPEKSRVVETPVVQPPQTKAKTQRREKLVDEIRDTATKAGQNIILRNINFYGGSHRFLPTSYDALDELLDAMIKIPTLVIEIQGHICCREDEGDGMDNDTGEPFLSFNRARAVYTFLVRNGIDKSRMTYRGFGHRFPIYDIELSEEERTANRRVEIKIVSK